MAHKPIIIDVETKHTFQEVGYDHKKLEVSIVGTYDYEQKEYKAYFEKELPELFKRLEHASLIIGFNTNKFDLPVLSPYYIGNITQFPSLDLLEEVESSLGFRVALDDLARATLNTKKSGHGFLAINYYKNGELEKLKQYCLDDVKITKDLYEFGQKNKKVYFNTAKGVKEIPVKFEKSSKFQSHVSLSLPF